MNIKLFGAMLVIAGSGLCGFSMAAAKVREERELRQLLMGLEYLECELQYHQTPLPQLCTMAAGVTRGQIQALLLVLAGELESQTQPDPTACMELALGKVTGLCSQSQCVLRALGQTLGRFDLPGQLKGITFAKGECNRKLEELIHNRDSRLRSYQTLGLCAGAALAILFL